MPRLASGVCLSTLLGLSACVALYHDDVGLPGVVRVTAIDPTTILISARSDGSGDTASVKDYALLKAADETLKRGYDHFSIADSQDVTRAGEDAISDGASMTDAVYSPSAGTMSYRSTRFESSLSEGEDILISLIKGSKSGNASANFYSAAEVEASLGPRVRGDAQAPILARLVPPESTAEIETNPGSRVRDDAQPPTPTHIALPESATEAELIPSLRVRDEAQPPTMTRVDPPESFTRIDPTLGLRIGGDRRPPTAAQTAPSRVALTVAALRVGAKLRLAASSKEDTLGPFIRSCNRRELELAAAAERDGLRYELECQ